MLSMCFGGTRTRAVFSLAVSVALELPATDRANKGIPRFSFYGIRVLIPPPHTAGIRAEPSWFLFRNDINCLSATLAECTWWPISRNGDLVSANKGLYRVHRQTRHGGDFLISQTSALEVSYGVDFLCGHYMTPLRGQTVLRVRPRQRPIINPSQKVLLYSSVPF